MKFTCLKLSFPLFRRSWENRLLTQAGFCVLNSKVSLSSAMKKRDINGLNKLWIRNHTVVASKCEVRTGRRQQKHLFSKNNLHQSQKNDALLCLWLSTSTKTNILLVLVKKLIITWWNYEVSLLFFVVLHFYNTKALLRAISPCKNAQNCV